MRTETPQLPPFLPSPKLCPACGTSAHAPRHLATGNAFASLPPPRNTSSDSRPHPRRTHGAPTHHRRRPLRHRGGAPARWLHRRRRISHLGRRLLAALSGGAAFHALGAHRRRHRAGAAAGGGVRGCVPEAAGCEPAGGRERFVLGAGAVDAGAVVRWGGWTVGALVGYLLCYLLGLSCLHSASGTVWVEQRAACFPPFQQNIMLHAAPSVSVSAYPYASASATGARAAGRGDDHLRQPQVQYPPLGARHAGRRRVAGEYTRCFSPSLWRLDLRLGEGPASLRFRLLMLRTESPRSLRCWRSASHR